MRVAVATNYDPWNRANWSGTPFQILSVLESSGCHIHPLGPVNQVYGGRIMLRQLKARLLRQNYLDGRDREIALRIGRQLTDRLKAADFDVVISFGASATSYMETELPIVLYNDATFAALIGYYPAWSKLPPHLVKSGHEIERRSFVRAKALIFTSEWAAESACRHYGVSERKIYVIPMGANIEEPDRTTVRAAAATKQFDRCELLYIGYEWHRKGGDVALRIRRRLCEMGVNASLSIVGCNPFKLGRPEPGVDVYGVLDKRVPEQRQMLDELFWRSHFLVHPARAECYGIALCEANAHGLPVITSSTGGIPSIVQPGANGYYQQNIDEVDGFCRFICDNFNPDEYARLSSSSFDEYHQRLSWNANKNRIAEVVRSVAAC